MRTIDSLKKSWGMRFQAGVSIAADGSTRLIPEGVYAARHVE